MKAPSGKVLERELPVAKELQSVLEKRRANNDKKPKSTGFLARVTDNDPMDKDAESSWP